MGANNFHITPDKSLVICLVYCARITSARQPNVRTCESNTRPCACECAYGNSCRCRFQRRPTVFVLCRRGCTVLCLGVCIESEVTVILYAAHIRVVKGQSVLNKMLQQIPHATQRRHSQQPTAAHSAQRETQSYLADNIQTLRVYVQYTQNTQPHTHSHIYIHITHIRRISGFFFGEIF